MRLESREPDIFVEFLRQADHVKRQGHDKTLRPSGGKGILKDLAKSDLCIRMSEQKRWRPEEGADDQATIK